MWDTKTLVAQHFYKTERLVNSQKLFLFCSMAAIEISLKCQSTNRLTLLSQTHALLPKRKKKNLCISNLENVKFVFGSSACYNVKKKRSQKLAKQNSDKLVSQRQISFCRRVLVANYSSQNTDLQPESLELFQILAKGL